MQATVAAARLPALKPDAAAPAPAVGPAGAELLAQVCSAGRGCAALQVAVFACFCMPVLSMPIAYCAT